MCKAEEAAESQSRISNPFGWLRPLETLWASLICVKRNGNHAGFNNIKTTTTTTTLTMTMMMLIASGTTFVYHLTKYDGCGWWFCVRFGWFGWFAVVRCACGSPLNAINCSHLAQAKAVRPEISATAVNSQPSTTVNSQQSAVSHYATLCGRCRRATLDRAMRDS